MSDNVCRLCGDTLCVDTIDFASDPRIDPAWVALDPYREEMFQVTVKCHKCRIAAVFTFHKPSFTSEEEMVSYAKKMFTHMEAERKDVGKSC